MESEFTRWSQIFSGSDFFYGLDPGPVARRAVRYARPLQKPGARALDVGCGEGQDLVFLAQNGYEATGVDFTATGLEKSRLLLENNAQNARLVCADVASWRCDERFEVVLAVNCLQFLGSAAPDALRNVQNCVQNGGILGFSAFARENTHEPALDGALYRWTLDELLANFARWQPLESARLWQWNGQGAQPFVTLIAQKIA